MREREDDQVESADLDLTVEPGSEKLLSSEALYGRWETQQWSVQQLGIPAEAEAWAGKGRFAAAQLRGALAELEVGEVTVTQTLSALVDRAPTEADRLYLCTQMADEARHVTFFTTYLREAARANADDDRGQEHLGDGGAGYGDSFEPVLRQLTEDVRRTGASRADWHVAVVYYHLMTEGVLAFSALQSARNLARRLELPVLSTGLSNVTRDEARHVAFGLRATRDGARDGLASVVADAYLEAIDATVEALVRPRRRLALPALPMAAKAWAAGIAAHWKNAEARMMRQLALIGLATAQPQAAKRWAQAVERNLDAYEHEWGESHLARAA